MGYGEVQCTEAAGDQGECGTGVSYYRSTLIEVFEIQDTDESCNVNLWLVLSRTRLLWRDVFVNESTRHHMTFQLWIEL